VPHLLAVRIVETVGEVDFVVEEGALGGCRRQYGHLARVRSSVNLYRQCDKPTVSESSLGIADQQGDWAE
jgi:hypothetical protein